MPFSFSELNAHLREYRDAADRIFERPLETSDELRLYFFELLVALTRVYVDCLEFELALPVLYERAQGDEEPHEELSTKESVAREMEHRRKFGDALDELPWQRFYRLELLEFVGLRSAQDFRNSFHLHVPEIYEETLKLSDEITWLTRKLTSSGLSGFSIGVDHLSKNHAIFLIPALQGVAAEDSWGD